MLLRTYPGLTATPLLDIPPAYRRTPLKRGGGRATRDHVENHTGYNNEYIGEILRECSVTRQPSPLERGTAKRGCMYNPDGCRGKWKRTFLIYSWIHTPSLRDTPLLDIPPAYRRTPLKRGGGRAARDHVVTHTIYTLWDALYTNGECNGWLLPVPS